MVFDRYRLGETDTLIELHTAAENHQLALELVSQAEKEVLIATYDLDAPVFSHEDFTEALSKLVRRHRNAEAKILLQRPNKVLKQGHRLIPLAQRLSSSIHIHRPAPEHSDYLETFMVVDGIGYFKRQQSDRYEGMAAFKAPISARDLRDLFCTMWERSAAEPQLRRLQI
jgi:hypothetical protein